MTAPAGIERIQMIISDVDGVLTDGRVYIGPRGEELMKAFHVQDGLGIVWARERGLRIAWVSARASPILVERARELGVHHLFQGVPDKKEAVLKICALEGVTPEEVAYIGDDENDLPVFEVVGFRVAVADAHPRLREQANWILERAGGRGALREVIDAVLKARGG